MRASRYIRPGAAFAIWMVLSVAVWSRLLEPLPPISWRLVACLAILATVGTGMVWGGRGWKFWVPLAIVAPYVVARVAGWTTNSDLADLQSIALVPVAVAVLAVAGTIGRRTGWPGLVAGCVLAAAPLPWFACAAMRQLDPVDVRPAHPQLVDLVDGSWKGVHLGDTAAAVRLRLGPPLASSGDDLSPVAATSWRAVSLPDSLLSTDETILRYRLASFYVRRGRVRIIMVVDPRAQTARGVGIGDNLAIARRAYPSLVCGRNGSGLSTCAGVDHGVELWVGPDPIGSITIATDDLGFCLVRDPSCPRQLRGHAIA